MEAVVWGMTGARSSTSLYQTATARWEEPRRGPVTFGSEEAASSAGSRLCLQAIPFGKLDHLILRGVLEQLSNLERWTCPEAKSKEGCLMALALGRSDRVSSMMCATSSRPLCSGSVLQFEIRNWNCNILKYLTNYGKKHHELAPHETTPQYHCHMLFYLQWAWRSSRPIWSNFSKACSLPY